MSETGWQVEIAPTPSHRPRGRWSLSGVLGRRARLVAAVAAVAVCAGAVDGLASRSSPPSVPAVVTYPTGAVIAPTSAQSSAWFCVGGSGSGGNALGTLVFTNPTPHAVDATVSAAPAGAPGRSIPLRVPADDQIGMVPAQVAPGPWVAATVLLNGGGVGVSEVVAGPLGWSTAPCASSTAADWYFAHGSTASGASLSLSLYNPSVTDAVVDITLDSSTSGVVEPPAYQGIAVPAGSLVVEDIGDHLTSDPSIATVVSATSGTVVAAELQSTPAPAGGGGSSLLLGVPAPVSEWDFPLNVDPVGGSIIFHVFNPSAGTAVVGVRINLAEGAAEPLSLRVPPHSDTDLVAEHELRIPTTGSYGLEFLASRGVGIVVDREVTAPAGSNPPEIGQVHGVPDGAREELLPAVVQPGTGASFFSVADLSSVPVRVTVESATDGAALHGLDRRTVRPGRSLVVSQQAAPSLGAEPLYVVASGPVAAELDAAPTGALGAVVVPGLILR